MIPLFFISKPTHFFKFYTDITNHQMSLRHQSLRRPSHQKNLNLSLTKMNPNRMSH